ncbi:MAG: hypothetical protein GKR91_12980 [Pseudomonadales bacterium]|nr:hypothetical protein [Pseudomonadales bacterium]
MFKNFFVFVILGAAMFSCGASTNSVNPSLSEIPAEYIAPDVLPLLSQENQALFNESERSSKSLPADSEFLVFIVDTSGSMFNNPSWNKMLDTIESTMALYPDLTGIQIVNDMGDYVLSRFGSEWIPNTETHRENLLATLHNWNPYSNSSPIEGLNEVFNSLAESNQQISIYVIGDDLQNAEISIDSVLAEIIELNTDPASGEKLARIHSIAFSTIFMGPEQYRSSADNYVALMSNVARENGGSFQLLPYN